MKSRDRFAIVGLFLALAIVGAALVIATPPGGSGAHPGGGPGPYREGVVGHPSSINPLTPRSQADMDLVALLFRGLAKAGPDGTVVPDLATWTISDDGRTYLFEMRKDARWDDGQPVTSADVVYTIGVVQDPAYTGPAGSSWQGITATAEGTYEVQITMTLPIAGFLRQAELPLLPAHLLTNTPVADLADSSYSTRPVGNGAYRIVELDSTHALLQRVTSGQSTLPPPTMLATPTPTSSPLVFATPTPKRAKGATAPPAPVPTLAPSPSPTPIVTPQPRSTPTPTPTLPELPKGAVLSTPADIELFFYSDSASAAADFRAGRLDAVGGLTPEQTDAASITPGSRLVPYQWASLVSVAINQRADHVELQDVNVRTALLAAIDRQQVLSRVLEGRGSLADLPIPSWSSAFDPAAVTPTPYSVSDAAAYLTTAVWQKTAGGWVAPKTASPYVVDLLTLDEASNPVMYQTALFVADAWRQIGLTVQLNAVPGPVYMDRLDTGKFTAAIVDFEVGLDPDLSPLLLTSQVGLGGSNVSGVKDPTLDQLLIAVRKTSDPTARQGAVTDLEKYISTTLPILPLAFRDYDMVVTNRVRGMLSNQISDPSGRFWDVIDWRLASDR